MCTSVFVSGEPISDVHIRKTGVGPEMEDHKSQEASHWRPLVLRPPGTCIMHLNYHFDALLVLHTRTENSDIFAAKYFSGVIPSVLQKLLAALNERTEWGQVFIIDTLETLAKLKASPSVTPPPPAPVSSTQHANSDVVMSAVKVTMGYLELVTNSDTLRALSRRCTVQMCTDATRWRRCDQTLPSAVYVHALRRVPCWCPRDVQLWQQGAPQQGQHVRILARSSSLRANTAGALDLHRSMLYKCSA
jgi:hypothetical protein